jgi:ribosomal protein S4E
MAETPGVYAKAFGSFTVSGGTIGNLSTMNCTVTRNSSGNFTITFSVPMKTTNYSIVATTGGASGYYGTICRINTKTTTSVNIITVGFTPDACADVDPILFNFIAFEV